MRLCDYIGLRQIGDGARQFQHPVIGPRRPVQPQHGGLQQLGRRHIVLAVPVDFATPQLAVGFALALALSFKGARDPFRDGGAGFTRLLDGQFGGAQGIDVQLHVDAVQQRAGQARLVAFDQFRRAAAAALAVAILSARTGIHGLCRQDIFIAFCT